MTAAVEDGTAALNAASTYPEVPQPYHLSSKEKKQGFIQALQAKLFHFKYRKLCVYQQRPAHGQQMLDGAVPAAGAPAHLVLLAFLAFAQLWLQLQQVSPKQNGRHFLQTASWQKLAKPGELQRSLLRHFFMSRYPASTACSTEVSLARPGRHPSRLLHFSAKVLYMGASFAQLCQ